MPAIKECVVTESVSPCAPEALIAFVFISAVVGHVSVVEHATVAVTVNMF